MRTNKPRTKILVDGGDPDETSRVKKLIGFVDGQTTNPSLIAKNQEVQQLLASGQRLTAQEQEDEYKKIVQQISPLVGDSGVSIEVFADIDSTAEQMLAQGEEMFSWIPNAYIKYPCTHEGLRGRRPCTRPPRGRKSLFTFRHSLADSTIKATTEWML
jgi:transaldolase